MKTYKGQRNPAVRVTVVHDDGHESPLIHRLYHSPDGFEWGYGGSGPADLALSICWDVLGDQPRPAVYQHMKWTLIAPIQEDSWWLSEQSIRAAMAEAL